MQKISASSLIQEMSLRDSTNSQKEERSNLGLSDLVLWTRHEDNSQSWIFSLKLFPTILTPPVFDSALHFLLQKTTSEWHREARLDFLIYFITFAFYIFLLLVLPLLTTWQHSDTENISKHRNSMLLKRQKCVTHWQENHKSTRDQKKSWAKSH